MEKLIRIDGFDNKKTRDGSKTFPCFITLFDGEEKAIGVFEEEVVTALKKQIDSWVFVIAEKRPNGYWNITKYLRPATEEEIPNLGEEAKAGDAEPVNDYARKQEISGVEMVGKVPPVITTRIIHELVDNRIVYNKYEFGKAEDRHTIKYKDINDFKEQYREIISARRVIDAELNPKQ